MHPFREGNGRAQREFARLVCLDCGYDFNLSPTTHKEMLDASITSFNTGDTTKFEKIFSKTVTSIGKNNGHKPEEINILTSDDLFINTSSEYDYYEYSDNKEGLQYEEYCREKISNMENSTKCIWHHSTDTFALYLIHTFPIMVLRQFMANKKDHGDND